MTALAQASGLVGTGMGERNLLWGRPESLTHAGTHGAIHAGGLAGRLACGCVGLTGLGLVGTGMGEQKVRLGRPESLTHAGTHVCPGRRLAYGCVGPTRLGLVGTGMGEQKLLWGRPESLAHGGPHAGPDRRTGSSRTGSLSRTSNRDSSGAPHREPVARARAARPRSAATAGGLA
jgi:hypothetical protein